MPYIQTAQNVDDADACIWCSCCVDMGLNGTDTVVQILVLYAMPFSCGISANQFDITRQHPYQ